MKKAGKEYLVVIALLLCVAVLTACSEISYSSKTHFLYSNDKGHSYGNGKKEYVVGETVYMRILLDVASNKGKISQVKAVLTIPNSDSVDAKYMDGQVITPVSDPVKNVTTYEFTVNASKKPIPVECVIQFKPNAAGSVGMTLVYDDNIDASYDRQSTLEFVKAEE